MRKILISGASRGIGKAIALKLLKEGHSLSLGVRKKEDLINTSLDPRLNNPESFLVHNYDATDKTSSKSWVERTVKTFHNIDAAPSHHTWPGFHPLPMFALGWLLRGGY